MKFTKMQGLGNDYLYVFGEVPDNIKELSVKYSDRHFGAGADGMIYISHSDAADFKMRIFNADGSEAKMCGNGIRCVGKYVYDKGYTDKTALTVETLSGIKTLQLNVVYGKVKSVSVNMGKAECSGSVPFNIESKDYSFIPVSVGNPHAVTFVPDVKKAPVDKVGPVMEKNAYFPDGVNVEFVEIIDKTAIAMRVWERGSGITMACGTGACASVAACVNAGLVNRNEFITVYLDGGALRIKVDGDDTVTMSGPAQFVYEGETL